MTAPNNPMPATLPAGATSTVVNSIRQAARATNVDFGLLMAQAKQESGFQADAKATGSSATGLYQFIDSTWLSMVQHYGDKYGIGALAAHITMDPSGRATVADAALRYRILELRKDPQLSASLAAEYAKKNKGEIEQALGRPAGNADIYMAHFLGAAGAVTFLKAVQKNGNVAAADILPEAAAVNRAVFYDGSGRASTVSEIYRSFVGRIDKEAAQLSGAVGIPGSLSHPGTSLGTSPDMPAIIRRLSVSGSPLSQPMAAMLNVFALSALKLLDHPPPSTVPAGTSNRRSI